MKRKFTVKASTTAKRRNVCASANSAMIGSFNIGDKDAARKMAAIIAKAPELFEDKIYIHFDYDSESGDMTLYDDYNYSERTYTYPCGALGCPEFDDYDGYDNDADAMDQYNADVDFWMTKEFPRIWNADSKELIDFCDSVIYDIDRKVRR